MNISDIGMIFGILFLAAAVAAGCLLGSRYGTATVPRTVPRACAFDGGGTAVAGSVTRTDTGYWLCTDDGRLVRTGR